MEPPPDLVEGNKEDGIMEVSPLEPPLTSVEANWEDASMDVPALTFPLERYFIVHIRINYYRVRVYISIIWQLIFLMGCREVVDEEVADEEIPLEYSDPRIVEPKLGQLFIEESDAYSFYNLYARFHGFGIRRHKKREKKDSVKTMQEYCCVCQVIILSLLVYDVTFYKHFLSINNQVVCQRLIFPHCISISFDRGEIRML